MKRLSLIGSLTVLLFACTTTRNTTLKKDDGKLDANFILINDVYEIAPLAGGKEGGMARVATLKKQYLDKNQNTFLVIAGDFVSPSVYSSLNYEGRPVRGRQMIEALNAAGLNIAIFGNHEFDIREAELQARLDESRFQWISSNAYHKTRSGIVPFEQNGQVVPETFTMVLRDADGTVVKIGFIGICLPFTPADFVSYDDPLTSAKKMYNKLKDSVDAVIAITHQNIVDDETLARELPGLAMILGGHEHDQHFEKIGKIYIAKALSNARSAYVMKLHINLKKKKVKIHPKLEKIDERISIDSATDRVVQKWTAIGDKTFRSMGLDPKKVVLASGKPLDGREINIRYRSTNLTRLVAGAMKWAVSSADVVLLNAGSIRVDDIIEIPVTEYDIIRSLPFGGGIREVDMKGSLLVRVLTQGKRNSPGGGFLIYNDAVKVDAGGQWFVGNQPVDPARVYHVALGDFLLTGKEANLGFLNTSNEDIIKVYPPKADHRPTADIRHAIIEYLATPEFIRNSDPTKQ